MIPSYKTTQWKVGVRSSGTVRVRVVEDGALKDYWVPNDPANTDYGLYQEWLAEGNRPDALPD